MLVRNPGGEWSAVEPVRTTVSSTLLELCRADVGALFELGEPRHLVAIAPTIMGFPGPDAVCLTPAGRVSLVIGTADETPERTVMRLVHAAGTMRHWSTDEFFEHLGGGGSVGGWSVDEIEEGLSSSLRDASFEILVAATGDVHAISASLDYLVHAGSTVRCFELRERRGPTMEAVEAYELARDDLDAPVLAETDAVHVRHAPAIEQPEPRDEVAAQVQWISQDAPAARAEVDASDDPDQIDFEDEPPVTVWRRHSRIA